MENQTPLVSIIIPAYNEEKYIEPTLKAIKSQTYRNIELIVVDNNSADNTVKIAKKYADRVVVEKKQGVTYARNRGAKEAKGEILLFVDADTVLEKRCIEEIVRAFSDPKVVCATVFIKSTGKFIYRFLYFISSLFIWLTSFFTPTFSGMVLICRKNVFEKVGGFDESLITCEDLDLTRKMKKYGKCIFISKAIAYSSPRRLEKLGVLKVVLYHIENYFRFVLLNKPKKYYPAVR